MLARRPCGPTHGPCGRRARGLRCGPKAHAAAAARLRRAAEGHAGDCSPAAPCRRITACCSFIVPMSTAYGPSCRPAPCRRRAPLPRPTRAHAGDTAVAVLAVRGRRSCSSSVTTAMLKGSRRRPVSSSTVCSTSTWASALPSTAPPLGAGLAPPAVRRPCFGWLVLGLQLSSRGGCPLAWTAFGRSARHVSSHVAAW